MTNNNVRAALITMLAILAGKTFADGTSTLAITEFMASNSTTLADGDSDYPDWIEIYNPGATSVSMTGCYLTDNLNKPAKWQFPSDALISIDAGAYLVVFASGKGDDETYVDSDGYIHTSFKLSASGEDLALVDTDGETVISSYEEFEVQNTDYSYGLGSNDEIGFLYTPTPGEANGEAGGGWVADTKFDVKRGFYSDPFDVTITCSTDGATIKYTTDCSTPSETNGETYSDPVTISGTTVLRVMAYLDGYFSTDVDTQTYLFLDDIIAQDEDPPTGEWPDSSSSGGDGPGDNPGGGGHSASLDDVAISASRQEMDYGMDPAITESSTYGDLIDDALLAIPTISLVTDLDYLFDDSTGIYANPTKSGDDWECPACVELIYPDGSEGFHVNTGLRIRGATSATASNPKHSFRIIMRSDYHDTKIKFPVMGEDGPKKFDKLDFRTAQNYSWNYQNPESATWLDDPFSHDTMRDMGHLYSDGFFFHLYLDGVYWGLYEIEQRPEAYYAQSWLGGDEEDYDALKADSDTGKIYATDGSTDIYDDYWTLLTSMVSAGTVTTAASYYQLQGMNADGSENESYPNYLDADNLIDYMLVIFFTGARDTPLGPPGSDSYPRNLNIVNNNENLDGTFYIMHDNEHSIMVQSGNYGLNYNRVNTTLSSTLGQQKYFNPWWVHQKLKTNAEYKIKFADRVHEHFFGDGALTAEACAERYQTRIDEIETAIIAESARWGDYLSENDPYTQADWEDNVNKTLDDYFSASPSTRTDIVLAQLISAGLYPTVGAPEFSPETGEEYNSIDVTITTGSGTIYYTTDGTDPRAIGGAVNSAAAAGASGVTVTLGETSTVKARAYSGGTWSALNEGKFTVIALENAVTTDWLSLP